MLSLAAIHDIMRVVVGLAWLITLLYTAPLITTKRYCVTYYESRTFGIIAFLALHQIGYSLRWLVGLSSVPESPEQALSSIGLQIMSTLIAVAFITDRGRRIGWKP